MSADKYKVTFMEDDKENNSIFALNMSSDTNKDSSGEIYYFNKNEVKSKKIQKLRYFNEEEKKFHIIVYNGRDLEYYKPLEDKTIDDGNLLKKLNEYAKCVIINITDNGYKNTYIFLREQSKISTDGIFEKMKIEIVETFKKGNLIDIVRALFNLIEDYHIYNDDMPKENSATTDTNGVVEDQAATAARQEEERRKAAEAKPAEEAKPVEEAAQNVPGGGRGKRKYKANVNQKSLKKMSTIIKKLLKINLNIKPDAKPKAKPDAKPKAKPDAKPKAKPAAKPKAKPAAKPKAKPAAKPKAKPDAKPKAKPAAKPKAKK